MTDALKARAESINEWLKCIEPFKILISLIFGGVLFIYGLGVTFAGFNNRLDNNASDIKTEQTARQGATSTINTRIDRAVDKILDAIKEVRQNQNEAAERGTKTREDVSYIKGILKQNYDNGSGN